MRIRTLFWSVIVVAILACTETASAASAFDPSARFPSRDSYCAVVQTLAGVLYAQVASAANAYRTTFADVISHNGEGALDVRNMDQIDSVDYVGMLAYLSGWDTTAAKMPNMPLGTTGAEERLYSQLIGTTCRNDTLRAVASVYGR
jgi:hypothetical protein